MEPVLRKVLLRKLPLPCVGHMTAAGHELVAPGELGSVKAAARGELPLGFGRQFLAGPGSVGLRIGIGDMHNRMIVEPADRAIFAVWTAPVGTKLERPPVGKIAEVDRMVWRREDERT